MLPHEEPGNHCFVTLSLGFRGQKSISEELDDKVVLWGSGNRAVSGGPDHASVCCRDRVQVQLSAIDSKELKGNLSSWKVPWPRGRDRSSTDTPKIGRRFSSSRSETSQGLPLGKELLIGLGFRVISYCDQ